ncbi:MAG: TlpA family protein disulfide reductase [Deltaproteobacteria bacterium]|nr:TlpA family protein disulfide reductase [Deltaproteobacteria bacterium]
MIDIRGARPVHAVFILMIALALLSGCKKVEKEKASVMERLPAGAGVAAPPFTIKTLAGNEISLEKLKGKVVVINFFASWCGPCAYEAPVLQRLYLKYRESGVEFVGIAVQDSAEAASGFVKEHRWTMPVGLDGDDAISSAYNVFGVPKTSVVGKDGRIAYEHMGAITEEVLDAEIKKALR